MAIEDYLKGSSKAYGQLAGSLLVGRKKEEKKKGVKTLLATAVLETFGAFQNQQKQTIIDNSNAIREQYNEIFAENKELFNSEEEKNNRALYRKYLSEPERQVEKYAKNLYNEDPDIAKHSINFSNRGKLLGDKKIIDESIWQKKLEEANSFFTNLKDNPLTTKTTLSQYNKVYMDEYKAALSAVEDDPTKKGLIRAAFNKLFGEDRNGNKRFGMAEKAELDLAFENQKKDRELQEKEMADFSPTIKDSEIFNTTKAVDYVSNNYQEKISEESYNKIIENIENRKSTFGMTENDILGIAISTQVLNNNNLSQVEQEIQNAVETFNLGYMQKNNLTVLPDEKTNIEEFKKYKSSKLDYLDVNVYKMDPITSKVNMLTKTLADLKGKENTSQYRIIENQLSSMGKDTVFNTIITSNTNSLFDPLTRKSIEQDIANEKTKENPMYTDIVSYSAHMISIQKDVIDTVRDY